MSRAPASPGSELRNQPSCCWRDSISPMAGVERRGHRQGQPSAMTLGPARARLAPRARRVPTTRVRCRECDCTRRGPGPLPALLSAGPGFLLVSTKHWLALSWPRGGLGAPAEDRARLPDERNLVQAGATDPSPEMRLDEAGAAPWDPRPVAVGVERPGVGGGAEAPSPLSFTWDPQNQA